jgi:hypothetical protein
MRADAIYELSYLVAHTPIVCDVSGRNPSKERHALQSTSAMQRSRIAIRRDEV